MTPAPKLAVFAVVATLAYLGLAILGCGGFAGFFSHSALIALASTLFVLTGVAIFSEGNLTPGEREYRTHRGLIVAFGAVLIVSHDRYFLDQVVSTIWELAFGGLADYRGNYSAYLVQRADRHARHQAEYETQQALIAKEQDFIRRMMKKPVR